MTDKASTKDRALNHFASWAFFWMLAFVTVITLVTSRWWEAASTGLLAAAIWRLLTSSAYVASVTGDQPNKRL